MKLQRSAIHIVVALAFFINYPTAKSTAAQSSVVTGWSALGNGLNDTVNALAVDNNGQVYAGGTFTAAGTGGSTLRHIGRWNGSSWSSLSSGLNGTVYAIAVGKNGEIYVGGSFTANGNGSIQLSHIGKWSGTGWSALGSGIDGDVYALAVDANGHLFAAGLFGTAGGNSAPTVAMWDGSKWSSPGSVNWTDLAKSLAASGSNIYMGGWFGANLGGQVANYIAKWNGNTWSVLGSGIGGTCRSVDALTTDRNGNVYAGGCFTTAGGHTANYIAKWDGTRWTALGSGISGGSVSALAADSANNVYVGGDFGVAGGQPANSIAKWDGSKWSALGSGIAGTVSALAVDTKNGILYVGGSFSQAGAYSANRVAKWDLTAQSGSALPMPFFWQKNEEWAGEDLLPIDACTLNKIGTGGCELTSAAMVFDHYGATLTPKTLNQCMGNRACPFDLGQGASCSQGKVSGPTIYPFSISKLDEELNQNRQPVILYMHKRSDTRVPPLDTHAVVATGGYGTDPANYTINDPWFSNGESMSLSSRWKDYKVDSMIVYSARTGATLPVAGPTLSGAMGEVAKDHDASNSVGAGRGLFQAHRPITATVVSGTAVISRITDVTMTVQLAASSEAGDITDMLLWTDSVSNTTWQPFNVTVVLPVSAFVYAEFRDDSGNLSGLSVDTIFPPPGANADLWTEFLPAVSQAP